MRRIQVRPAPEHSLEKARGLDDVEATSFKPPTFDVNNDIAVTFDARHMVQIYLQITHD
jgi:hypothetical protein